VPFFTYEISSKRPAALNEASLAASSHDTKLSANGITLDRYQVYYTSEGCVLALHFTPEGNVDMSKITMGLALLGRNSHDIMETASGSLWAFTNSPNRVSQTPFSLWITFKSLNLEAMAKENGEAWASEGANPYVEIYLSSDAGITFAGGDMGTVEASPRIGIMDIQPFRRS
jgi:hypothetical protein